MIPNPFSWLSDFTNRIVERQKIDAAIEDREWRIIELHRQMEKVHNQIKELQEQRRKL